MPSIEMRLTQEEIALAIEDYVRNRMGMAPKGTPISFSIDKGDPGHPCDSGVRVSARLGVCQINPNITE